VETEFKLPRKERVKNMKVAVIGSRSVFTTDIGRYISDEDEVVLGGAVGIDACAAEYAKKKGLRGSTLKDSFSKRYAKASRIKRLADFLPSDISAYGRRM